MLGLDGLALGDGCSSVPAPPKHPKYHLNRGHKALHRGTLGGLGGEAPLKGVMGLVKGLWGSFWVDIWQA